MKAGNIMSIGYDLFTGTTNDRPSFGALVAAMDLKQRVDFFSAVSSNVDFHALSTGFSLNVVKALHAYKERHQTLPAKIIIYRGGVSHGQLGYVRDIEVQAVKTRLEDIYDRKNLKLELLFIIVNKRIHTPVRLVI